MTFKSWLFVNPFELDLELELGCLILFLPGLAVPGFVLSDLGLGPGSRVLSALLSFGVRGWLFCDDERVPILELPSNLPTVS